MKRISALAVAALAALAMTAAVGASSASAMKTVLCDNPSLLGCHFTGTTQPAGTTLGVTGELTIGGNSFTRIKCFNWVYGAVTTAEIGEPLPAESAGWLLSCKAELFPNTNPPGLVLQCQKATFSYPAASLNVTGTKGKGTVSIGSESEPLTFTFECTQEGTTVSCEYTAMSSVPMNMVVGEGMTLAEEAVISEAPVKTTPWTEGTHPCGKLGEPKNTATLSMTGEMIYDIPKYFMSNW